MTSVTISGIPWKIVIVTIPLIHVGVPEYATLNVFIFAITSAGKGPSSQTIINIVTGSMPILLNINISLHYIFY